MRFSEGVERDALVEEHVLRPLTSRGIIELVERLDSEAEPMSVFEQSGGNLLLAMELAQTPTRSSDDLPRRLTDAVNDRLASLSPEARRVLRWAAILGRSFRIEHLVELVPLACDPLLGVLSTLERHKLLGSDSRSATTYGFRHALVHRVVYSEIAEPRRALMHIRAARHQEQPESEERRSDRRP